MSVIEFNGIHSLFDPEGIETFNRTLSPFRNHMVFKELAVMLESDPEFEVFLPLIYFKQQSHMTNPNAPVLIEPVKWFVSNRGRVMNTRNKNNPEYVLPTINSSGYPEVQIRIGKGKVEHMPIHRILGCVFLPLGEDVQHHHPKDLQVLHINPNKEDFSLGNLKWGIPPELQESVSELTPVPAGHPVLEQTFAASIG